MKLKAKVIIALLIVIIMPVILLAAIRFFVPGVNREDASILLIVVASLIVTVLILTTWIYASFVKPLSKLRRATKEIREGNLDYELTVDGEDIPADEIGELCQDFEAMRKRLKQQAEEKTQVDAENKMLIRNISHDLKTPITAIKGYASGILDGVASTPEKQEKYVRTILTKANDMDALIDELTLYSKINTNRIPYTFKRINAKNFFTGYAEGVRLDLDSQGIELDFYDAISDETEIIGDEEQLRRVMNNIISNSVKYMNKKTGLMAFRLRDADDFIQIEIEDNGKGISRKDLPYIFDRFYRTDSSRNSKTGGSGIGLSIVKKIVEDHGGRIWATSDEDVGTVMHFTLRKYIEKEEISQGEPRG